MAKNKQKQILDKPRALDEINREYSDLCAKAGQLHYKMKVDEQTLASIHLRISEISKEADLRNKLDVQKGEGAKVTLSEAEVVNA